MSWRARRDVTVTSRHGRNCSALAKPLGHDHRRHDRADGRRPAAARPRPLSSSPCRPGSPVVRRTADSASSRPGGTAAAQLSADGVRPLPSGAGPVSHLRPGRPARGLNPLPRRRHPPDRLGQQSRVGRVGRTPTKGATAHLVHVGPDSDHLRGDAQRTVRSRCAHPPLRVSLRERAVEGTAPQTEEGQARHVDSTDCH
jgi:hypothetical protein